MFLKILQITVFICEQVNQGGKVKLRTVGGVFTDSLHY